MKREPLTDEGLGKVIHEYGVEEMDDILVQQKLDCGKVNADSSPILRDGTQKGNRWNQSWRMEIIDMQIQSKRAH